MQKMPGTHPRRRQPRNVVAPELLAAGLAFSTYFCMYAFRKPFAAASFEGSGWGELDLKTTLIISQVLGYTLSKYLGVKYVSEASRRQRLPLLLSLIAAAECALLLLPLLPPRVTPAALFLNGLPLGMVWGLVVRSLEGRRSSDLLLAALSCSFIVASGVVKDIGRALLGSGINEFWMPAATGALFLVPFTVFAVLLNRTPEPAEKDVAERSPRQPMGPAQRRQFLSHYWPGLLPLGLFYLVLTAFRDFRDNYGAELLQALGYGAESALFSQTELPIAVGILIALGSLSAIRGQKAALLSVFGTMLSGMLVVGASTWALELDLVSGLTWMLLSGFGAYLAYVPFSSFLFEHLMSATRSPGTAVFAINIADALGYTGSVTLLLFKDLAVAQTSKLTFFNNLSFALAGMGVLLLSLSCLLLFHRIGQAPSPTSSSG